MLPVDPNPALVPAVHYTLHAAAAERDIPFQVAVSLVAVVEMAAQLPAVVDVVVHSQQAVNVGSTQAAVHAVAVAVALSRGHVVVDVVVAVVVGVTVLVQVVRAGVVEV